VLVESLILLTLALVLAICRWATIAPLMDGIDLSSVAEGMEMIGVAPVIYRHGRSTISSPPTCWCSYWDWPRVCIRHGASRHVPVEALTRI